jgi:hypothetical protein
MPINYLFTGFENASPIQWELDEAGVAHVGLIYDRERDSPNRAVLHWHFQVQGTPGHEARLLLKNFDNIWNGRHGSPIRNGAACAVSENGKDWSVAEGRTTDENFLDLKVVLPSSGTLFVARIEPYRISDHLRFMAALQGHRNVAIEAIGKTVEGRELEMVRVGRTDARYRLLLRARAHPWETGGNWVLEGLMRAVLNNPPDYCIYAMPMSNKDGVAHGGSRFNLMGKDLNRDWGSPANPAMAPENTALEKWLDRMARAGQLPHLAIDFHNDSSGKIHVSRPEGNFGAYWEHMKRLETALTEHTWFTEGSTGSNFQNAGTFGEGLLMRYGIDACIMELNCNWSAGLSKAPLGTDWKVLGQQMRDAFSAYFHGIHGGENLGGS